MSRELARLIAGHVFLHACMAGMRMAAPLLALREGHSEAAVGVLLALFALTQVFLALPAGRYADRHGLKRPVAFSVMVAALGAAIAVALPVFPVLCLSALMTGGATGAASIALQRHVGRAAQNPTQLKQVFSWLAIGPANATQIMSRLGLRKLPKRTGTGLAAPRMMGLPTRTRNKGSKMVPKGSMCLSGLSVTRPNIQAVSSPK